VVIGSGCTNKEPLEVSTDLVTIEMTGQDYSWRIRYAGPDGRFETQDDFHVARQLVAPVDSEIEIQLKSNDYIYSLEAPHADKRVIAVPDMTFCLRFEASTLGRFVLPEEQFCSYAHPDLVATLTV
jgi:cytochrome c oxidase subunit 2